MHQAESSCLLQASIRVTAWISYKENHGEEDRKTHTALREALITQVPLYHYLTYPGRYTLSYLVDVYSIHP